MESQQTFTFRVPLEFDQDAREDIAIEVIDFIVERTQRGLDRNNQRFAGYSDAYVNSKDFSIAGKSRGRVDLTLTGDMLTDLRVLNTSVTGFITIGYKAGSEENDRAAWQRNNLRPNFPKRDFLGIADKDLNRIINNYRRANPVEIEARRQTSALAQSIVDGLLAGIFNDN